MTNHPHREPDDNRPVPEITTEQMDDFLVVFRAAWISGYCSAGHACGMEPDVMDAMERSARHTTDCTMADPIARNQVADWITHLVTGAGPCPDHGVIQAHHEGRS